MPTSNFSGLYVPTRNHETESELPPPHTHIHTHHTHRVLHGSAQAAFELLRLSETISHDAVCNACIAASDVR